MIRLTRKKNRIRLSLKAVPMGPDLCVIITGGDTPHLGALTVVPESKEPVTVAFDEHKDDHVTKLAARILRREFSGNFVICCGIHLDHIEKREIADVLKMSEEMVCELCRRLNDGRK
jgi:hypothetical protein